MSALLVGSQRPQSLLLSLLLLGAKNPIREEVVTDFRTLFCSFRLSLVYARLWPLRLFTYLLNGNKSKHFGDMDLIELIKSNNFQQQSYFNVSGYQKNNLEHSHRKAMELRILSTK